MDVRWCRRPLHVGIPGFLLILTIFPGAAGGEPRYRLKGDPEEVARLMKLIGPGPMDSQWLQIPWMPSWNIYEVRKKAAEEGKPILLWYMAGEPLGLC